MNFISVGLQDRAIKATKDENMDILEQHEEAKLIQDCLHASVAAKCPSTYFFSYCNFLIIDKKKLNMISFSHVKLAYDVAMRRNISVNILFTSLTKEQHAVLIIKYCLAGCDIGRTFFWDWQEVCFQTHGTRCTEISGTERSWPWAFIKLSKVYLHSVCWSNI